MQTATATSLTQRPVREPRVPPLTVSMHISSRFSSRTKRFAGGREMPAAFYDDAGEGKANVPVRENLGTDNPLCELPASSAHLSSASTLV